MKLTIEPTGHLTRLDGVPVRLWEGRTESGRPVWVFVHRISTADDQARAELDRALVECEPPAEAEVSGAIPLRMIL